MASVRSPALADGREPGRPVPSSGGQDRGERAGLPRRASRTAATLCSELLGARPAGPGAARSSRRARRSRGRPRSAATQAGRRRSGARVRSARSSGGRERRPARARRAAAVAAPRRAPRPPPRPSSAAAAARIRPFSAAGGSTTRDGLGQDRQHRPSSAISAWASAHVARCVAHGRGLVAGSSAPEHERRPPGRGPRRS